MKICLNILIVVMALNSIACQKSKSEQPNGNVTAVSHHEHVGEIAFTNGYIPLDDFKESDKVSSFDLSESSNLSISIFLDRPLTDHLAKLAPELSNDDLCDLGNYQFTFYVDGELAYEENLNFGAGTREQKMSNTVLSVPLASTEGEDSWGRYLWMRFLFRGKGDAALRERGDHLLKIEMRPYVMTPDIKVGEIIAQGEVNLNVVKPVAAAEDIAIQKIQPMDDWPISKDAYDQKKIELLNKKIAEKEFRNIQSIAVIKDGRLLIEEYFNGSNRETRHDPRSVGKTFASTIMGMAIEEGHISGSDATLNDFYNLKEFENYMPAKDEVTLESLLMMSSGFDGNDDDYDSPGNEENMYPTEDWVKFTLDLKMAESRKMKKDWSYFTAGVVVLGDILNMSLPDGLDIYADKNLFEPLGIREYNWLYTPTNVPNTAGGIRLRTIDFAKYGQLYKNGGTWRGKRILTEDWVSKSLSKLVKRQNSEDGYYGYLFWNDTYTVNGKKYEVAYCSGNGGNKIFVFKDLPLVVVVTATAYNLPYAHPQVNMIMEEYILPAVISK